MSIDATSQLSQLAQNFDAVIEKRHPKITDICIRSIGEPQDAFSVRPNIFVRMYHYLTSKWSKPRSLDVQGKAISVQLYDPASNISGIHTLFRQALYDTSVSEKQLTTIIHFALQTDKMADVNKTGTTCQAILREALEQAADPEGLTKLFSTIEEGERHFFAAKASEKVGEFLKLAIAKEKPEEVLDAWKDIMERLGGNRSPLPYTMASFDGIIKRLFTLWRNNLPEEISEIPLEDFADAFKNLNISQQQTKFSNLLETLSENMRDQLQIQLASTQARAISPLLFELQEKIVTNAMEKVETGTPAEKQDLAIDFTVLKVQIEAMEIYKEEDSRLYEKRKRLLNNLTSCLDRLPETSTQISISAPTQQRTANLGNRLFSNYSSFLCNPYSSYYIMTSLGIGGEQALLYSFMISAFAPFFMSAVDHIVLQPLAWGFDKTVARVVPKPWQAWTKTSLKLAAFISSIFLAPKMITWWHTRKIVPIVQLEEQIEQEGGHLSYAGEADQRVLNAEAMAEARIANAVFAEATTGSSWWPWGGGTS